MLMAVQDGTGTRVWFLMVFDRSDVGMAQNLVLRESGKDMTRPVGRVHESVSWYLIPVLVLNFSATACYSHVFAQNL